LTTKKIAKNTLLLYGRMFFAMIISLYTSRLILEVLGVEDFGIYNVVGGIIVLLAFLNHALAASTQRFIVFELGKNDINELKTVFNSSIFLHWIIAVIVLVLAETAGLFFLNFQMNIPIERIYAANWVYQFTVISFLVTIINVPFLSLIMAYEKMGVYAIIGTLEVFLKLFFVLILFEINSDKLIMHSFFLFLVSILTSFSYRIFASKINHDLKSSRFTWDKVIIQKMAAFAGWNLIGVGAGVSYNQGVNILLNIYFGPVVNAARGISFQVFSALNNFVANFQIAINPSITKEFAQGNVKESISLVFSGTKFVFFLTLVITLPFFIDIERILTWWLQVVPENTILFTKLITIEVLIGSLSGCLQSFIQSTGKIKNYQLVISGILLLNLPVSYFFLENGFGPELTFFVSIVISFFALFLRIFILSRETSFPGLHFFKEIVFKVTLVSLLGFFLVSYTHSIFMEVRFGFFLFLLLSTFIIFALVGALGLNNIERVLIFSKIRKFVDFGN
jgi:O-antigen/teichoic acid export membrane protein